MTPEQLERLLRGSRSPSRGHRGIGFRVVRELVEAGGGDLRVMSAAGLGTRVQIEWPVAAGRSSPEMMEREGAIAAQRTEAGGQHADPGVGILLLHPVVHPAAGAVLPAKQAGAQRGAAALALFRASRRLLEKSGVADRGADPLRSRAGRSSREFGRLPEGMPPLRLLVVDDDAPVRKACSEIAAGMGFVCFSAGSVPEARAALKLHPVDMLLLDLKLPGGGGLQLLEEVKAMYPEMGVVVMTAFATVPSAVEAMRIGAGDYLTKPFALEELTSVLDRSSRRLHFDLESRRLRERLRTQKGMDTLIGRSPEMEKVYRILSKVAYSTHPVLILGESGTGKELVARSIHVNGPNAAKPFVPVDCGSLVPTLIESELFGHVKGAFTGRGPREGRLAGIGRGRDRAAG